MRRQYLLLLIYYGAVASTAQAQLYLIAGSPNPSGTEKYASALLRVEANQTVTSVADLTPRTTKTVLITVSYDWRKAFIDSAENNGTLIVLDMDKAAVVKKCKNPNTPGMSGIEHWLTNSPVLGPAYEGRSFASPPSLPVVEGMSLDPSLPCNKSFASVDPSDIRYVVAHGQAGVADVAPYDGILVGLSHLPAGQLKVWNGRPIELDYEVPSGLRSGVDQFTSLVINDSHVLVLNFGNIENRHRILVFRKLDQAWKALPIPSNFCMVRGFGRFIGITEMQPQSSARPQSAGSGAWRKGSSAMGPDLAERFQEFQLTANLRGIFPGRLYLYDVEAERLYLISTNQADSEVLLAENGVVYYRVSDCLYSATITAKDLGTPHLLAKGEAVRDAHWAFTAR